MFVHYRIKNTDLFTHKYVLGRNLFNLLNLFTTECWINGSLLWLQQ